MFGFGKKKRQEKAKRELLAIGERVVGIVNDALTQWRSLLEARRAMLDEAFAERVVGLESTDGLSFETSAEIEALALMKNWTEGTAEYQKEFAQLLDRETLDCLAALEMGNEVQGHLDRNIAEVTQSLENDLDLAITEAVSKRGDTTTRSGDRNLSERCLQDDPFLDSLTLRETLDYVASLITAEPTAQKIIGAVRRLYDLALFEHSLTDDERSMALTMADVVESGVHASLQDNPEGLAAFQEAVSFQKERARHWGFGSLQWKLVEESVQTDAIIGFIARQEHADLLPAFLEMMEPDVIAETRQALLNAMVSARAEAGQSAVEFLTSLALTQDESLAIQLDPSELRILRESDAHPAAAEQLVAELLGRRT